jgi:hypothetical protein
MERVLLRDRVTVPQVVLMVGFIGLAVAVESAFATSLRLPGHRAFPGALALLMLAELFAPAMLVCFAAATSSVLALTGYANPLAIAVWTVIAGLAAVLYRKELARSVVTWFLLGLGFGLLSWLTKTAGFHKTPEVMRCAGHCAFGAAGGVAAWAATRAARKLGRT